jgi:Ca2+-dependent lipid-binding protein
MSDPSGVEIEDDAAKRRRYGGPHSGKRPIPTIQKYRERKRELQSRYDDSEDSQSGSGEDSKPRRVLDSVKAIIKDEDVPKSPKQTAYPSTNRNYEVLPGEDQTEGQAPNDSDSEQDTDPVEYDASQPQEQGDKTATEAVASAIDPREKRKIMKKTKRHGGKREVTDPVTHLPIVIHDQTDKDLASIPLNEPEPGADHTTATGLQGAFKSDRHLDEEQRALQRGFNGVQRLFPPPEFNDMKQELSKVYQQALYWGLVTVGAVSGISFLLSSLHGRWYSQTSTVVSFTVSVLTAMVTASGMGMWVSKKVNEIFDDEVWDAARSEENRILDDETELPESVQWLNRLLASIWPLVNPDLFSSLIDMVEDIMQASLPKTVRMVSVDDLGQGNEAIRILGMRWIPTGAASRTVDSDGKLKPRNSSQTDRTDPQNGQGDSDNKLSGTDLQAGGSSKENAEEQTAIREGFEAEEGDFLNLELAISYRSRSSGKSMKAKAKNAHMYLKFYLPGGVAFPVWVELRSFVATMRVRLQLTVSINHYTMCVCILLTGDQARPAIHQSLHLDFSRTAESYPGMCAHFEAQPEPHGHALDLVVCSKCD